jgi:hypothetical protein
MVAIVRAGFIGHGIAEQDQDTPAVALADHPCVERAIHMVDPRLLHHERSMPAVGRLIVGPIDYEGRPGGRGGIDDILPARS